MRGDGKKNLRRAIQSAAVALSLAAGFSSCTKGGDSTAPSAPVPPLALQGKHVYMANCTACHNSDPTRDGAVGPAIAGSSLELVRARVMEAKYPPGYTPKRQSHAMAPLPHLKDQIEALQAFLAAPGT
jgi:mono/diheme cytochrome c family protein